MRLDRVLGIDIKTHGLVDMLGASSRATGAAPAAEWRKDWRGHRGQLGGRCSE